MGAVGVLFTSAQAKAIPALSGTQSVFGGCMGFINTADPQPNFSNYHWIGVAVHELAEGLGIMLPLGR